MARNGGTTLVYLLRRGLHIIKIEHHLRTEKDTCINNLKLNINLSSTKADYTRTNSKSSRDNLFWRLQKSQERSNNKKDKHTRGSLDNVSRIPWDEQCSLRRTRSFAVSRENLFYSLDYLESNNRRAQLIPRAKLVERSFVKDTRYESLRLESAHLRKFQGKPQEIPPDYSPLPSNPSYRNFPLDGNIYDSPPGYTTRNNSPLVEIIEDFGTDESRYEGKSFEELTGLSLPNYYPDSELTDNVSIVDIQSTYSREKSRYVSLDNISWTAEQPESISYDENIVLTKKIEGLYAKPRTIRGPTPYQRFDYEKLFQNSEKSEKVAKEEAQSSIEFETNTNCDEIKLNNENISKEVDKVVTERTEAITIEVPSEDPEEFKSIIEVEQPETKTHSHNYLKEFLETQKGSKKPLQSFIAKKLSNLSRKKSNLATNQFYSLPDITASKNLHKCEKIDRKLRHCERLPENRFIVNIGNHFDITAKSNIPVDFQVKIKKKKPVKNKNSDKDFEEAVKNVNTTLQNNGFCIDFNNNSSQHISLEVKTMDPEIQEKVDNIRNYWTKIAGVDNNIEKCDEMKIDNNESKVSTVKKKFEPEPVEEKAPNKVQLAKQVFEPKLTDKAEKISPTIKQTYDFFEKPCYESLCPSAVELVPNSEDKKKPQLSKSNSINVPQFDHVRYKVIKPELFNKRILANCENEEQFDGLMQYLQDYSFQELLIDNNIVIIEPIRSKVPHKKSSSKTNNPVPKPKVNEEGEFDDVKQGIRKHFFFRPIRVNKEVNDDELPRPEVVRQARQFFEKGTDNVLPTKEQLYHSSDPDKDKCSTSTISEHEDEQNDDENLHDSLDCCTEYVSEDILEKIREYGTTVTYYGGTVVNQHHGQPILTKVIMEEIKDNEKRCMECKSCRRRSIDKTLSEVSKEYQGLKFKLVKSNSCSSRLELVGAPNKKDIKKMSNITEKNNNVIKEINDDVRDKNAINENIKLNNKLDHQPRIIGEERKALNNKYVQWSQLKRENNKIQSNDKINNYDYHEKLAPSKRNNEMEFEPYEVA